MGKPPSLNPRVILEYLEETQINLLHPSAPLHRAQHRAWMEFCSAILSDIWGFYTAADEKKLHAKGAVLAAKFEQLENEISDGPYFEGEKFLAC